MKGRLMKTLLSSMLAFSTAGSAAVPVIGLAAEAKEEESQTQGQEIYFAKLSDDAITVDQGGMSVEKKKVEDMNTEYYEVTFSTKNLPKTTNSNNQNGYWLGWAVQKPTEAQGLQVTKADSLQGLTKAQPEVKDIEKGVVGIQEGYALYYQANERNNQPDLQASWVKVDWYSADPGQSASKSEEISPVKSVIVHAVFKDITFLPDGISSIEDASAGFKYSYIDANDKMNEILKDIKGSALAKNERITDADINTLWAGFKFTGTNLEEKTYTGKVFKDGKLLYEDSETFDAAKGVVLYYSFENQLKDQEDRQGSYTIQLLQKIDDNKELPVASKEVVIYKAKFEAGEHGAIAKKDPILIFDWKEAEENLPETTPDPGYKFSQWTFTRKPEDDEYTRTYRANFAPVSLTSGGNSGSGGSTTNPDSDQDQETDKPAVNPDGSTSEKTENADGSITEKITYADGTVSEKTTQKDGSSKETINRADGSKTEITNNADGSSITSNETNDGSKSIVTKSKEGAVDSSITLSPASIEKAQENVSPVEVAMPAIPADHKGKDITIDIALPADVNAAEISIPVENGNLGTVAMVEDENGELVPIKESLVDENGKLIVPLDGSKKIVIKDNSKAFSDMPGYDKTSYPGEGVAYVSARKIFNGNEDGSFNLNGNVTRGMLARVLYNLEGNPSVAGLPVPAGVAIPWYKDASAWAANKKLMAQGSDFRGEDLLTREQLAMILWREQGKPAARGDISAYDPQDVASISSPEMLEAVSWAVGEHIIGQNSPINGQKESTRGEVANMLYRFLSHIEARN